MDRWIQWLIELQSIAQAGLYYTESQYDHERYERLREIVVEMMAHQTDLPQDKVYDLFCNEIGYQTPKIDTRAAIFKDDQILLVHENNDTWSLPGGWCDVNESIRSNTIKEVREEAGLDVQAIRLIALHDRKKHNYPEYPYNICKVFVLCEVIGGSFKENIETTESRYFSLDDLPDDLANNKNTKEQIAMCFKAYHDPDWKVEFD